MQHGKLAVPSESISLVNNDPHWSKERERSSSSNRINANSTSCLSERRMSSENITCWASLIVIHYPGEPSDEQKVSFFANSLHTHQWAHLASLLAERTWRGNEKSWRVSECNNGQTLKIRSNNSELLITRFKGTIIEKQKFILSRENLQWWRSPRQHTLRLWIWKILSVQNLQIHKQKGLESADWVASEATRGGLSLLESVHWR